MKKIIALIMVIFAALLIIACKAPVKEITSVGDVTGMEDADLEQDIKDIDALDQDLNLSELDEIDTALKELEE
ncbi:MAG: hypothetical protein ABIA37_04740 [Candidatus Woesearchaeota archaeon]